MLLQNILDELHKSANSSVITRWFFASFAIALVFVYMAWELGIGRPIGDTGLQVQFLDAHFGYTMEDIELQLNAYGEEGIRLHFWTTLLVDSVFPIAYANFLGLLLVSLLYHSIWRYLALIPYVVILVDYLENTHTALILHQFPTISADLVTTGSYCSYIKWILLGITLMAVGFGCYRKNRRQMFNAYQEFLEHQSPNSDKR